jgi:hypothetical protein
MYPHRPFNLETLHMTDDERRLLLACASCIMAQLVPGGPREEQQIKVMRKMLEPFTDFLREDIRRMREDD